MEEINVEKTSQKIIDYFISQVSNDKLNEEDIVEVIDIVVENLKEMKKTIDL